MLELVVSSYPLCSRGLGIAVVGGLPLNIGVQECRRRFRGSCSYGIVRKFCY